MCARACISLVNEGTTLTLWVAYQLHDDVFGAGSMNLEQRDRAVETFSSDPDTRVFLLSLKAGGVALNLTAASHVFLMVCDSLCLGPLTSNVSLSSIIQCDTVWLDFDMMYKRREVFEQHCPCEPLCLCRTLGGTLLQNGKPWIEYIDSVNIDR